MVYGYFGSEFQGSLKIAYTKKKVNNAHIMINIMIMGYAKNEIL